ncbi:MAG: LD-carboxypeptidase [Deltaproteobacteria bacterium]|nr:LD-carboxypeptidase [Deltaproteobacteria bacterium]
MSESAPAWVVPAALTPGASIRVVAPSGPFDARLVWRGLGWLRQRYEVRFDRGMFETRGYLAGDDPRREGELAAALLEPGVSAVICARGGYGASRFAHRLDWTTLRTSPRWLVGFSDVTALHVEAAAVRVSSWHAPNVTALGQGNAEAREAFVDALEHPRRVRSFAGLDPMFAGRAVGPLFGGNLTLLHACAAAGRLRVPPGAVLFLEDVTEQPYRLDRMLTTLLVGGHLEAVSGVVLGEFTDCRPGRDGVTVEAVLRELLAGLGKPVASGLPCGHGLTNVPLLFGARATLTVEPNRVALGFEPPSTRID